MQSHNFRRRGLGVALLAMAACLYLYATLHPKATPRASSQATINHIIDATEPICRTLLPHRDTLHFTARPYPTFSKNGARRNLWTVECLNNAGKELVHVLWDEDNRRCVSISQTQDQSIHASTPKLKRADALAAARNWVARLNIADADQAARAPSELRTLDSSFRVFLRLPDGLATVWIDANTGECFNALLRSYPDASTMQAASPSVQKDVVPHS